MSPESQELSIYIHSPYCRSKCSYCDFYSIPKRPDSYELKRYRKAITEQFFSLIKYFKKYNNIKTMYFGGGTASLLAPDTIYEIINLVKQEFHFNLDCEITVEGNPESLTLSYVKEIADAGVNRINAGIQSLRTENLNTLRRESHQREIDQFLSNWNYFPVWNKGVDLIYGIPGQTVDEFYNELKEILSLEIKHLSLYALTVEEETPYFQITKRNQDLIPDDRVITEIFLGVNSFLESYSLYQYEISNYAIPGFESRHNKQYWMYGPYMGLGPAAHSFNRESRFMMDRDIEHFFLHPDLILEEVHRFHLDFPLSFLRLKELPLLELRNILKNFALESYYQMVLKLFQKWEKKDYGKLTENKFIWNSQGLLFLDSRIEELSDLLSGSVNDISDTS